MAQLLTVFVVLSLAADVRSADPPSATAELVDVLRHGMGPVVLDDGTMVGLVVDTATTVGPGRVAYRGRIADIPGGWFVLATNASRGNEVRVAGEVSLPGAGHYHIRSRSGGPEDAASDLRVTGVDPRRRVNCVAPSSDPTFEARLDRAIARPRTPPDASTATPAMGPILIDVMIAWTSAARIAVGGLATIEAQVDSYIEYTNMVYEASGIDARVRLVQTAETTDVETGNILVDLADLRAVADGFADELHALRDAAGADLVSLIVDSPSAGVAYQMQVLSPSFASSAFSVVGAGGGGIVFAHEAGHNMGCAHNNGPGAPDTIFCYSFGHRLPGGVWNTIMSNPPGTHLDFFSSPQLLFEGTPLGISGEGCPSDAADSVRSINEAAATVAAFRPTMVPVPCVGDVDGSGDVGFADLLVILGAWGPCPACPEDLDGNGSVGFADVLQLIGQWGPCSEIR